MDFLINGTASMLRVMGAVLGGWSFPGSVADHIQKITPYLQKANMIVPISAAMTVFGLWIALQLILMAYYFLTRTINLIRGAG